MKHSFLCSLLILSVFCKSQSILIESEKQLLVAEKNNLYKNPLLDNYDVCFYFIDLNATNQNKYISGNASIKAKVVNQPLNELMLQLHNSLTVDSIKIDNQLVPFTFSNNEIHAIPNQPIPIDQYFTAIVYYHGTSTGTGIKNGQSPSWGKKITWTLSESYHAMDWFPCKQELTDKADSAYIYITCDNTLKAGSNGLLTNIEQLPGNKVRYEWKTYYPIDYYLISFTISEYQEYIQYAKPLGYNDSIFIQHYIYDHPGYLPYFQNKIDQTKDFVELLSELYGLYPFHNEKYGHCTAPIGGGMEHQTMTTLSSFSFELVIHELGHQWFGDYVTCKTWQDIWINEGFATYTYYLGAERLLTLNDAQQWMENVHQDIMSQPDGSIYVPFAQIYDESRIFDYRLTYEKGAAIIHTMRFMIDNDSIFFGLLKAFLQQYAFSTATADDFRDFATAYTGINFTQFFDEWFYGEGYPTYSMVWNQQGDSIYFTFSQQTSAPTVTPFFHNPVEIKFSNSSQEIIHRITPQYNNQNFSVYVPFAVQNITIDPDNDIVNKVGSIQTSSTPVLISNLQIYPNPCKDIVYIQSSEPIQKIQLTNSIGQELNINLENYSLPSLNISHLNKGIYYLTINNKTFKLVKL